MSQDPTGITFLVLVGVLIGFIIQQLAGHRFEPSSGDLIQALATAAVGWFVSVAFQKRLTDDRAEKELLIEVAKEVRVAVDEARAIVVRLPALDPTDRNRQAEPLLLTLRAASNRLTLLDRACKQGGPRFTTELLDDTRVLLRSYKEIVTEHIRSSEPYTEELVSKSEVVFAELSHVALQLAIFLNRR